MAELKQTIPNLETLKGRLNEVSDIDIRDFVIRTNEKRLAVTKNQRYLGILSFSFVLLFFSLALIFPNSYIFAAAFLLLIPIIASAISWSREHKLLIQELNSFLIPIVSTCLDREISYSHETEHSKKTLTLLNSSELFTEPSDLLFTDGIYKFTEPYPVAVQEILIVSGKGKSKRVVFQGVFVEVTLNMTLSGVTFVSTEGDKDGFGHQSFFGRLIGKGNYKETVLEWNQFEKDLHVVTNDAIEARYILTPNFMECLHSWWIEGKENIRIVFRGNKMLMLLPDSQVKILSGTTSTDAGAIKKYALSVLKPLWRALILIENIKH